MASEQSLSKTLLKIEVLTPKRSMNKIMKELRKVGAGTCYGYETFTAVPVTNYYTRQENTIDCFGSEVGEQVKKEEQIKLSKMTSAQKKQYQATHGPNKKIQYSQRPEFKVYR